MLVDQIRTLTNSKVGLIEKIIYQIQAVVSITLGRHYWVVLNSNEEDVKKIVNYFTKEGFTVETEKYDENDEYFSNTTKITISW